MKFTFVCFSRSRRSLLCLCLCLCLFFSLSPVSVSVSLSLCFSHSEWPLLSKTLFSRPEPFAFFLSPVKNPHLKYWVGKTYNINYGKFNQFLLFPFFFVYWTRRELAWVCVALHIHEAWSSYMHIMPPLMHWDVSETTSESNVSAIHASLRADLIWSWGSDGYGSRSVDTRFDRA